MENRQALTAAVNASSIRSDGRDENDAAPSLVLHTFNDPFDQLEGSA